MKKLNLLLLILVGMNLNSEAQIIINELQTDIDRIELYNAGDATVDVSSYFLCSFPLYTQLSSAIIVSGNLDLGPDEYLVVSGHSMGDLDDELGLYLDNSFGSSTSILDYLEWGSTGHARSSVAMAAGIWTMGDFVDAPPAGESIMYDGSGNSSSNWFFGASTFGAVNEEVGCTAEAGTLSTSSEDNSFEICAGDGIADPIEVNIDVTLGDESQWVITDTEGLILGLPESGPFDLEGAGDGICQIWNISYNTGLTGLEVDSNVNDLQGCFDLSNAVTVTRIGIEGGEVSTTDGETTVNVVVGDGEDDIINFQSEDSFGDNYAYIITDDQGNILGFPESNSNNFEDAEGGTCRVYGFSYYGDLITEGAETAIDVAASGCYELSSNFITVERSVVGVYENVAQTIRVYPNPAVNNIRLDIPQGQSGQVFVYSATGRLVKSVSIGLNTQTVDVADLVKGSYVLVFESLDGTLYRASLLK